MELLAVALSRHEHGLHGHDWIADDSVRYGADDTGRHALRVAAMDTLVVTKLDRLARSARQLPELVDQLEAKGVTLRILNFGGDAVDTQGATGRLMLNMFDMFAAMAQFEREMMLERQREGIAKAKADGK
jgi:DNA invertase Pin-like site-specific DNA recombinase